MLLREHRSRFVRRQRLDLERPLTGCIRRGHGRCPIWDGSKEEASISELFPQGMPEPRTLDFHFYCQSGKSGGTSVRREMANIRSRVRATVCKVSV